MTRKGVVHPDKRDYTLLYIAPIDDDWKSVLGLLEQHRQALIKGGINMFARYNIPSSWSILPDDIVLDAVIQEAYEGKKREDPVPISYILRTMRSTLIRTCFRNSRLRLNELYMKTEYDTGPDATADPALEFDQTSWDIFLEILPAVLGSLSPTQRAAVALWMCNNSAAQISKIMGKTENNIGSTLSQARKRMARLIAIEFGKRGLRPPYPVST